MSREKSMLPPSFQMAAIYKISFNTVQPRWQSLLTAGIPAVLQVRFTAHEPEEVQVCPGSPLSVRHLFTPLAYSDLSCSVTVLTNGGHQVRRTFPKTMQLMRHPQKALKIIRNFPLSSFHCCSCLK